MDVPTVRNGRTGGDPLLLDALVGRRGLGDRVDLGELARELRHGDRRRHDGDPTMRVVAVAIDALKPLLAQSAAQLAPLLARQRPRLAGDRVLDLVAGRLIL